MRASMLVLAHPSTVYVRETPELLMLLLDESLGDLIRVAGGLERSYDSAADLGRASGVQRLGQAARALIA